MSYLNLATERLNYCTKAIDFLSENARFHANETNPFVLIQDQFVQPLTDAIKFIAPPDGQFFSDADLCRKAATSVPILRLPYDVVAIEFPSLDVDVPRQIALAMTIDACARYRLVRADSWEKDYGAIVFAIIQLASRPGTWAVMPGVACLTFASGETVAFDYRGLPGAEVIEASNFETQVNAVTELIAALYHGVRYVDLPAPKRLNEKRERKGESPLFEYKLLELHPRIVRAFDDAAAAAEPGEESSDDGGRRSPRLHSRRGHWRHNENGKVSWVRPSLVGKKGFGLILKDYNAEALRQ